jgi:hypothetical protein
MLLLLLLLLLPVTMLLLLPVTMLLLLLPVTSCACREEIKVGERHIPRTASSDSTRRQLQRHPSFPHLPPATPLTFTLTAAACMSDQLRQRPNFEQLLVLLKDMHEEVATGHYINSLGRVEVSPGITLMLPSL